MNKLVSANPSTNYKPLGEADTLKDMCLEKEN